MKPLYPILVIFAFQAALPADAQEPLNLVRNPSFEEHDKRIYTWDQFPDVTHWNNVTLGLAEIFSRDAKAKSVGIPLNDYGRMEPKDGAHYAGFFALKDDERRDWSSQDPDEPFKPGWAQYSEYLQGELKVPLLEDRTYEVSFFVALAENSDRAVSGIGAYFGPLPLSYTHRRFLEEKPQVYTEEILKERGEWVEIKGRFVADGDEAYIVIGAFPSAIVESLRIVDGHDNKYAYYYVDHITVTLAEEEE
jgi:hypothetical protein